MSDCDCHHTTKVEVTYLNLISPCTSDIEMQPLQGNGAGATMLVIMLMGATILRAVAVKGDGEDMEDADDNSLDDDDVSDEFVWESLSFEDCGKNLQLEVGLEKCVQFNTNINLECYIYT